MVSSNSPNGRLEQPKRSLGTAQTVASIYTDKNQQIKTTDSDSVKEKCSIDFKKEFEEFIRTNATNKTAIIVSRMMKL